MSEKYKFNNPEGVYFITPTIVHWIDLFTRREYCDIITDSLEHCQKHKGLVIYAWCIMPSHLHLIIGTKGLCSLSGIVRDFKKYTSKKIIKEIGNINESRKEWLLKGFSVAGKNLKRIKDYKVWQDGNHPIELDTNKMQDDRLSYLHFNPVEAGFVMHAEDYMNSSARDYCGEKGILEIEQIG